MKDVESWVEEKFRGYDNEPPVLFKISFPGTNEFRKSTLKKLNLMNINHSTITPDLIGASRHCNVLAEDYE